MKLLRVQLYELRYTGKPHPCGGWEYTKRLVAEFKVTEFTANGNGWRCDTIADAIRYKLKAWTANTFDLTEYSKHAGDYGCGRGWVPIACGNI